MSVFRIEYEGSLKKIFQVSCTKHQIQNFRKCHTWCTKDKHHATKQICNNGMSMTSSTVYTMQWDYYNVWIVHQFIIHGHICLEEHRPNRTISSNHNYLTQEFSKWQFWRKMLKHTKAMFEASRKKFESFVNFKS